MAVPLTLPPFYVFGSTFHFARIDHNGMLEPCRIPISYVIGASGLNDVDLEGNTTQTASATGIRAISVGRFSVAAGSYSIAIGSDSTLTGATVALSAVDGIAIGTRSFSARPASIAIGSMSIADSSPSVNGAALAIGDEAEARNDFTVSLGYRAKSFGVDSMAFGRQATANNNGSIAIGPGASSTANNAVAIGGAIANTVANSIALGSNGVTSMVLQGANFLCHMAPNVYRGITRHNFVASPVLLTGAQFGPDALISYTFPAGLVTLTLPTVANVIAAFPYLNTGDFYHVRLFNGSGNAMTIVTNTGWTPVSSSFGTLGGGRPGAFIIQITSSTTANLWVMRY